MFPNFRRIYNFTAVELGPRRQQGPLRKVGSAGFPVLKGPTSLDGDELVASCARLRASSSVSPNVLNWVSSRHSTRTPPLSSISRRWYRTPYA